MQSHWWHSQSLMSLELQLLPKSGSNPAALGGLCANTGGAHLIPSDGNRPLAPRTYRGKEAIKISSCKVFHSSITDGLEGGGGNTESSCGWLELRNSCSFAVGLHHLSCTSFSFDLLRDVNFTYVAALNVISLCYYFCNWGWKDFNIRHCICLSDQILIALVLRKKKMRVWVTAFTTPFLTSCKTHIFYSKCYSKNRMKYVG